MKTALPPYHQPQDALQRLLELLWGFTPFIFLAAIVILSFYHLTIAAALLLAYTAAWFLRLVGYGYRLVGSYYRYRRAGDIDWPAKLSEVMDSPPHQALIVATFNEPIEMLQTTLDTLLASDYDPQKVIVLIAYEERAGATIERSILELIKMYDGRLKLVKAVKHPAAVAGEAEAKAGNITHSAKWLSEYCRRQGIAPADMLVTTLDADNRPHEQYLAALAYTYLTTPKRTQRSYQPIPLFTNNIWDASAISRLLAADTSFWFMMDGMHPRRMRLFSAYSQSLQTLEDTDYWNVESVVEDGHQYWRAYFTYGGDHRVIPIWLPIYQDAVVAGGFWNSLAVQFNQLSRWSWGTADTPFVIRQALRDRRIGWVNKLVHVSRQVDDYMAWATTSLVLAIGAWIPWLVEATRPGGHSPLAFTLFHVIVGLQLLALLDLLLAMVIYLALLPPRPARYGRGRSLAMVLQWVLEPLSLVLISLTSLMSYVRLIINKPLEKFHATTKGRP